MPWKHIRISRFGGPEVLELVEETDVPDPGPGEVRVKVLAAGTGFTDSFIRRGRYPDFKEPLPFIPGYDIVGIVERTGPDVTAVREGEMVADLCVVGGYTQYAVRPARLLVPVPDGLDPAGAVSIPLGYLTAFQMLVRYRRLPPGATILVIGASGTVGTALLDLARHFSASKRSAPARPPTRPSSRVSGPRQSIIEPKISSQRRAPERGRRGCRVRRHRGRSFFPFLRLFGARWSAGRLWVADHGGWARRSGVGGPRSGSPTTVGCAWLSVQRPLRAFLQRHRQTTEAP